MLGDIDTHDGQVRDLVVKSGAVFVSVDYRLAPEDPFPAGAEDCYAATVWVAEYASPIRADDLSGLPAALIITAEYDPLRDEGEAYGKRLQEAGVEAEIVRVDGMFHGFFGFGDFIDKARECMDDAAVALKKALAA